MTVSQLIAELKNMPQDVEVHFAYDYGDRTHTRVAPKVHRVEEGNVTDSAYHRMPKIVDWDVEDDEDRGVDDHNVNGVVVIS